MYISLYIIASACWLLMAAQGGNPEPHLKVRLPSSPTKISFLEEPSNVHVDQNGRVRLRCHLSGLQPYHIVTWSKNNQTISKGKQLTGDRFMIDRHRYTIAGGYRRGYYDLRIWDVVRLDTGNYSCSVYQAPTSNSSRSDHGPLLLKSRMSHVTVYYLPPLSYPECPTEMRYREIQVGETVPVCHSQKGFPPINLKLENPLDASRVKVDSTSVSDFIFVTLNITELENGMTYWCKASSKDFPYYQSRCQVGPLNVVYKPRAVIRPLRYAIHKTEDAVFVCEIESSPMSSQVSWNVHPPIESNRIELYDNNRTLQITGIRSDDDGRLLSCTATNSQGNDTAHRVLVVRQPDFIPHLEMTPAAANTSMPAKLDTSIPHCWNFAYRILVPTLIGIIVILILVIVVLLVRSKLWIFSKRLDEHSAQTEIMRPLTDYEIPPAIVPIDNKQLMLNIT
ncbi:uncharacterized protein LOC110974622 isoform X1 [Acanthaster planci]|uniref:Uncharacterized protein LOC110974622 isoform X1 n=1 Tax=Acanthaster planci TaxID=133434 RepID=A0A8B7XPY7_ACAPL|nr:uncharacterized protein LOC110974622 isoform X1 [Acanthaster planci]